jgi:hypothetical protein
MSRAETRNILDVIFASVRKRNYVVNFRIGKTISSSKTRMQTILNLTPMLSAFSRDGNHQGVSVVGSRTQDSSFRASVPLVALASILCNKLFE